MNERIDEFSILIDTGMKRVPHSAGAEFDDATTKTIQNRLDEFEDVRTRGYVESHMAYLRKTK
jgi:hypothetical protein